MDKGVFLLGGEHDDMKESWGIEYKNAKEKRK
jgi:hypothetical protein